MLLAEAGGGRDWTSVAVLGEEVGGRQDGWMKKGLQFCDLYFAEIVWYKK